MDFNNISFKYNKSINKEKIISCKDIDTDEFNNIKNKKCYNELSELDKFAIIKYNFKDF